MKLLFCDIETSANQVYCWGIWEQNISINQMITSSKTMCWSAKWQGSKEVMYSSIYDTSEKKMLQGIHKLLDEADIVITYNGIKFDLPTLRKEFLLHDMPPPSPFKQIDMLRVARSQFRFQSNKLDYVAQQLGLGKKTSHEGFQLWVDCMAKKPSAWKKMKEYNKNDTVLLEKVYNKMLPWIPNHPHVGDVDSCPSCGSKKMQRRGTAVSVNVRYQRWQCTSCGKWSKGEKDVTHVKAKFVGVH